MEQHQEPRFLLPLLVPLILWIPVPKLARASYLFWVCVAAHSIPSHELFLCMSTSCIHLSDSLDSRLGICLSHFPSLKCTHAHTHTLSLFPIHSPLLVTGLVDPLQYPALPVLGAGSPRSSCSLHRSARPDSCWATTAPGFSPFGITSCNSSPFLLAQSILQNVWFPCSADSL